MNVNDIAKICHEANRAYCESIGDNSQQPWESAQAWQAESAVKGVRFRLENPNAEDSAQHDSWRKDKAEDGWIFGPVKSPERKEHPCMVPFEQLPDSQKAKDVLFGAIVNALRPFLKEAGRIAACLVFFACFACFADHLQAADNAPLETIALSPIFKAGEFNLELGGTATLRNESRNKDDLNFGAALGANYWFTRGFGFGLRGESEDTHHSFVDRAIARFSVRAPLWDTVAPYGYLEGGFDFEVDRWLAGAGGGLEWRPGPITKGRVGFFAEAGLQVDPRGAGSMRGAAGIRFPF